MADFRDLLTTIYGAVGLPHAGSWLTPDFGVTERAGASRGIQENPGTGGVGLANLIAGKSNPGTPAATNYSSNPTMQSIPNVLGLADSNLGGGTGNGSGGNLTDLGQQLAESETDRRIRMVRELFDQGKQQVAGYRQNIENRFNDIAKAIAAFRDRSTTLRDNAGQEITNTAASTLGSNAKTAQQLAGTANAQGRNLGLSSRVQLGQKLLGNLQSTQGNVLAKKGENIASNNALFQERQDTANSQESDARTNRDAGLQNADLYDRQNLANFGSNYEGAQTNFASLLNNILGKAEALNAIKPLDSSGLTAYSPNFSGIVNTINGVLSSVPNGTGGVSTDAANLANPQTYADYLKRFKGLYTG